MKVQCDVCSREEATVFCCADEAALCGPCDGRIHSANKLARRHRRLSLVDQSPPLCDICQEKRGYVFCQEDRAVLCRSCDDAAHTTNHLTARHARFLLTGVRFSSSTVSDAMMDCSATNDGDKVAAVEDEVVDSTATTATSSISDYLLRTLPGWCVEDLLLDNGDSSAGTNSFTHVGNYEQGSELVSLSAGGGSEWGWGFGFADHGSAVGRLRQQWWGEGASSVSDPHHGSSSINDTTVWY